MSRPDVVIATSPQLLVGLSGWLVARRKRVPFVFEVRDLWPESLTAVGMGDADSLLQRCLARIAGFLYQRSDHVVVVTPAFEDYLVEQWRVPREKISVIENGVETRLFAPNPAAALKRQLGARGKICSVLYRHNRNGAWIGHDHRSCRSIEAVESRDSFFLF